MNDEDIVRLYWDRNEQAITESSDKYEAYCTTIARNILLNNEDAEECVNDTWLRAWNSIPPHKPSLLSTFLGKITRNLSFDKFRKNHRAKRFGTDINLILDELEDIVSGKENPEDTILEKELICEINTFLMSLTKEKRYTFILRYYHAYSIAEISDRLGISTNGISTSLSRTRKALEQHLTERGYRI